jgi:polar amino acid transport system permease protein
MIPHKRKLSWLDIALAALILVTLAFLTYRIKMGLDYKWNWSSMPQFLFRFDKEEMRWIPNVLMQGLFTTVRLSLWSTLFAIVLGTVAGLCRVSESLFKRLMGGAYVQLVRNLPPLVLVFIFYFFIGEQIMAALGVDRLIRSLSDESLTLLAYLFAPPQQLPAFLTALLALTVFEGAYITEIIRAGIESVGRNQWEASYALGLSRWQQMRYIILPQAFRRILPPLSGQFVSTIKDSAIVSVISIQELTFQGMELMAATYYTFEIWITITLLYLLLTLSLSFGVNRLEIHLRKRGD